MSRTSTGAEVVALAASLRALADALVIFERWGEQRYERLVERRAKECEQAARILEVFARVACRCQGKVLDQACPVHRPGGLDELREQARYVVTVTPEQARAVGVGPRERRRGRRSFDGGLTLRQVADQLGVNPMTLYKKNHWGQLPKPSVEGGKAGLYSPDDVMAVKAALSRSGFRPRRKHA